MIRALVERTFTADKKYVELFGLSTDSKPTTGIVTGSVFVEVNTGKCYLFNEDASSWVERMTTGEVIALIKALSGGGGSGGCSIIPTEIENDLYTETLGEVVEFQVTVFGQTNTYNGIEAVGMTSDIASEIQNDTSVGADPAPMKYTYRIGGVIYDNESDAQFFVPILADDGKYYFITDDTVFSGASGEVVAIYKTALVFPPNVLCLFDSTDPKGDGSYLPEYVEYDDGYWVSSDYDASGFYNELAHGNAAYAVLPNSDSNNCYVCELACSFYTVTDGDKSYLYVSLLDATAYIYNWTGANANDEEENEESDDGTEIIINPIGGGDHEMPAPDDGDTM